MLLKLKRYKYVFFTIFLFLIIIGKAYYQYYKDYFSYAPIYYEIKEKCGENGTDPNYEHCQYYPGDNLERYLQESDPVKKYERLDAISLSMSIIQSPDFGVVQVLSPLFLAIAVIGTLHAEWKSGIFRQQLLQMDYKKYRRKMLLFPFKIAWIPPCTILLILFLSCMITKFNFQVDPSTLDMFFYDAWNYHHFPLYTMMICSLQYLISLFFSYLALYCVQKNKNLLVAIISGYLLCLFATLFVYLVVYVIFLNKILGWKDLTEYFTITGYWYFDSSIHYFLLFAIAIVLVLCSFGINYYFYQKKERIILNYERQIT